MKMKIKEVADLVGISVRTLQYYDQIGLLKPSEKTKTGYRLYTNEDLETLQQILFFKELGFPLKIIKEIIHSPSFDREEALKMQREMLRKRKKQLDQMIETIDKTLRHMKGEIVMTNEEKFQGFDFSKNEYEEEARERWGDEAVDRSNEKINQLTNAEKKQLGEEMNAIFRNLAMLRDQDPSSKEAQDAIHKWYQFLKKTMGEQCNLDVFRSLGQMYVDDERFTKNIDQFGEGLAKFMRDAMELYAKNNA